MKKIIKAVGFGIMTGLLFISHSSLSQAGILNGGFQGSYYNNTTLSGSPAFTRKDVRIDFDWGTTAAPGGSLSAGYNQIGHDNFSASWIGQVTPAFSETYTFSTYTDGGVRVYVRPANSGSWTTVIDDWASHSLKKDSGSYLMTANAVYDVRVEYMQGGGAAVMKLDWSSPSVPEEVIDPNADIGINNPTDFSSSGFTDIVKGARNYWTPIGSASAVVQDANGWPMGDAQYYFQESLKQGLGIDPLMLGTITFSFNGKATVKLQGNVDFTSLNYSYDPGTNTTIGSFKTKDVAAGASSIQFTGTSRTGVAGGAGGITNLKLMRPMSINGSTSYPLTNNPIYTPEFKNTMSSYTTLRYQLVADQEVSWADRTLPTYFNQSDGKKTSPQLGNGAIRDNGFSWEYKIMLANETGRDIMISVPTAASSNYISNLVNLLKYGSNASGVPYTSPTVNPAFPPLNSNLRVYIELENELWNSASIFAYDYNNLNSVTASHIVAKDADYAAINYDNLDSSSYPYTTTAGTVITKYKNMDTFRLRMALLKMIQISNAFRSVWGDDAMMTKIRPVYEWQYANLNNTAKGPLTWADNYFNNADGVQHVTNPKPINYYIYGGGGGTYYGASNGNGLTTAVQNSGFDDVVFPSGYNLAPTNTSFTFNGTAGIANHTSATLDIPVGNGNSNQMAYITDKGSMSFTFTVPNTGSSNTYAFNFKAINRLKVGATSNDREAVRVYLDGTAATNDVTARTQQQANGYTPSGPSFIENGTWKANNVSWTRSSYYYTKPFTLTPGTTHTITIVGMGNVSNASSTDQTLFIDNAQITSLNSIYDNGFLGSSGDATGQPSADMLTTLKTEANWAKAYGLKTVAYEGGWALGGDDGGSPLQMIAKYNDVRSVDVQQRALQAFFNTGGDVSIMGTYTQWPSWSDFVAEQGMANITQYSLIKGTMNQLNVLKPDVTNGFSVPGTLTSSSVTLTNSANGSTLNGGGSWMDWNILVPTSANYTINTLTSGTNAIAGLAVDGVTLAKANAGSPLSTSKFLPKGMHTVMIRSLGNALSVSNVAITVGSTTGTTTQNQPLAPTIVSLTASTSVTANLQWSPVKDATKYIVSFGFTPTNLEASFSTTTTSASISNLFGLTAYYFGVKAVTPAGTSNLSDVYGITMPNTAMPVVNGTSEGSVSKVTTTEINSDATDLFKFSFTNLTGNESSAAVSTKVPSVTVSDVVRGTGFAKSTATSITKSTLASIGAVSSSFAQSLAEAVTMNQYYEFSVTPASKISIGSLSFTSFFQNLSSKNGAGIAYSVNDSAFSSPVEAAASGAAVTKAYSKAYTVNLASATQLQNVAGKITFRVYLYGNKKYETVGLGGSATDIVVNGTYTTTSTVTGTTTSVSPVTLTATCLATGVPVVNLSWNPANAGSKGYNVNVTTTGAFDSGWFVQTNDPSIQITDFSKFSGYGASKSLPKPTLSNSSTYKFTILYIATGKYSEIGTITTPDCSQYVSKALTVVVDGKTITLPVGNGVLVIKNTQTTTTTTSTTTTTPTTSVLKPVVSAIKAPSVLVMPDAIATPSITINKVDLNAAGSRGNSLLITNENSNSTNPVAAGVDSKASSMMIATTTSTVTGTTTPVVASSNISHTFTKNLGVGMKDPDVVYLQKYLNTHGYIIAQSDSGSPGNESNYFGVVTQKALAKFQASHNLLPAEGYLGALTRTYINSH